MKLTTVLCVLGLASAILPAADAPYIGKWKLNPARSQFAGETTTFEKMPSGMIRRTSEGVSNEFRTDGKEYPTPDGGTAAVKELAPDKWEIIIRMKGKVVMSGTSSVKGDTLTTTSTLHKPDGGTVAGASTSTRVSGGPGFFGKWKSAEVKAPVSMVEISANGADGVTSAILSSGSLSAPNLTEKIIPRPANSPAPKIHSLSKLPARALSK